LKEIYKFNQVSVTNTDKVYEILKKRIIEGIYRIGQQIRIADTSKEFKVSQTPVREALIKLSAENFVVLEPYRGAVVKGFSQKEVVEIFTIRNILEGAALEHGIPSMKEEDFKAAENILMAAENEHNPGTLGEINWNLHMFLYRKSQLPILCEMIESLRSQTDRYLRVFYSFLGSDKFINTHLEILEACKNSDVDRAVSLLKRGIDDCIPTILRLIDM